MSNLLSQASLVMIPSGYKEDIVYSQIPTNGNGDLSFTRASDGTRINSSGLVEVCPWNLVKYSEDFGNAGTWQLAFLSISTNSGVAPNGTTTADLLYPSSSQAYCYASTTQISVIAGQTYTQSVYLKRSGFRWGIVDNMAGSPGAWFDLLNGVVGNVSSGCTASIENVGNGWYRCSVTSVAQSSTNYADFRMSDSNGGSAVTANGTDGLLAWGFQLNLGSTAKPYFPTTDRLNVPRLTYQNGGGGCPSLLLEKQSTNQLSYSEQIQNADWNVIGGDLVVTGNAVISPDGTQNAGAITLANSANRYFVHSIIGLTGGVAYTYSVYMKSASGNLLINMGGVNGLAGVMKTVTTEWQRFTYTFTPSTSYGEYFGFDNRAASASTSGTLYFWGAQVEASSYPTSYIPTTTSSATRVADVASKTGISSLIGQTEGTFFVDINITKLTDNEAIGTINSGGYTNNTTFQRIGNTIQFVRNSATQSGASVETQTILIGRHKMAIAYKSGDTAFYLNGSQVSTTQTQTFTNGTLSVLRVGTDAIGALPITESFNEVVIFPTRLTNSELAQLTA